MELEEHERRRRIRELILYEDATPMGIVETIIDEFEVSRETVETDLETVHEWMPKLDVLRRVQGISLLAEVRRNRQRLHQMADDAHEQGELTEERNIRAEINRSINLERQLKDSKLTTVRTTKAEDDKIVMDEILGV